MKQFRLVERTFTSDSGNVHTESVIETRDMWNFKSLKWGFWKWTDYNPIYIYLGFDKGYRISNRDNKQYVNDSAILNILKNELIIFNGDTFLYKNNKIHIAVFKEKPNNLKIVYIDDNERNVLNDYYNSKNAKLFDKLSDLYKTIDDRTFSVKTKVIHTRMDKLKSLLS